MKILCEESVLSMRPSEWEGGQEWLNAGSSKGGDGGGWV